MSQMVDPRMNQEMVNEDEFRDFTPVQSPKGVIRKEETRYLFNALDVITPARKRNCRRLREGGHEVSSFCLQRTRGFIRKGRITPLDMGGEPILEENAPDDSAIYPITNPVQEVPVGTMIGSQSPLVAIPAYPGIELPIILSGSANAIDGQRFCLVELTVLVGHKYTPEKIKDGIFFDPLIWDMQIEMFPDYPKVPTLLTEFRDSINAAHRRIDDPDFRKVCEEALTSCEMASVWANERIESEHRLMKQGALATGYAYTYSELAEVLLEQLGLPRQDQELKKIGDLARSFSQGVGQQLDVAALIQGLSAQNREFAQELLKGLAAQQSAKEPAESKGKTVAEKESGTKTSKE